MDGMYFFLLFTPIILSVWMGYLLRKKIVGHLHSDLSWNHSLSIFVGISVQSFIIITGVLAAYFLIKFV
jgi:hypothetical protein